MSVYEIIYKVIIVLVLGALFYLQKKQNNYLKEKLDFAEKWENIFNVKKLLEQVKSHKELIETITEQSKAAEIDKIKRELSIKSKKIKEPERKYMVAFFVLSILTLKLDPYTRKKTLELIQFFDKEIAQDLKNELVKMVPKEDKERIKAEIS